MDAAWTSFAPSTTPLADPLPGDFSTRFRYPITTEDSASVVAKGIQTLRSCAPLVLAFNPKLHCLRIDDLACTTEFTVTHRRLLPDTAATDVTVVESRDGTKTERRYLLIEGEDVAIALRVEEASRDACWRCVPQEGPRLYLGFPLVGTDHFSLPTVANSFSFGPTEPRDGVYLGQADDKTNRVNQQLVEAALALHVKLIRFAATNGYAHSAILATVPPVKEESWLNADWLRQATQDNLIEPIRKTPSVVPVRGEPLAPRNAVLPWGPRPADKRQILELRCLLEGMEHTSTLLPSPEEAEPWSNAIRSWMDSGEETTFGEAWDGRKLAEEIAKKANGRLEHLRTLLVDQDSAVEWLNELCGFLCRNGVIEAIRTLRLVLDQAGYLDKLPNLYRDVGIDEELKRIADDLLGIGLREQLRDVRITSLSEEEGKGHYSDAEVVEQVLKELRKQVQHEEAGSVEKPKEASNRLLAWMVRNDRLDEIDHFPVWSETHGEEAPEVIWLERTQQDDELPLAPVGAWPPDLREFADLFPRSRMLAGSYFDCLPKIEQWERLGQDHRLVRTDVVVQRQQSHRFGDSPPDEALTDEEEHESTGLIDVVDVTYFVGDRIGVMARVPDSPKRAILLWRFLTEYMIPKNTDSVEAARANCECGQAHSYYGAAWLKPLTRNKWVPLGGKKRGRATAQSLARLFANDESNGKLVTGSDDALRLLSALGVTQLDLAMESLADNDEEKRRILDADLARILASTDGDLAPVSRFVEDLQSDEGLLDHLNDRRERVRMARLNHRLGAVVEGLVKEALESEGFDVRRTGIGSDFEVEYDTLDEAGGEELAIRVARSDGRTWLIEVKGTRGKDVRMTLTQARTAIKEGEQFLLCVAPVDAESAEPEPDQVRSDMRFVKGIGRHLGSLCDEFDGLEERRLAATEAESPDGVRLEVVGGKARICVDAPLWNRGVSLDGLIAALGHAQCRGP